MNIRQRLKERKQVLFRELFSDASGRLELVVTFIAVLELMKRLRIKARQEGAFGEIWIYRGDEYAGIDTDTPDKSTGEVAGERG